MNKNKNDNRLKIIDLVAFIKEKIKENIKINDELDFIYLFEFIKNKMNENQSFVLNFYLEKYNNKKSIASQIQKSELNIFKKSSKQVLDLFDTYFNYHESSK
ncbi:hypothetical protein ACA758_02820 [Mycoplasmopsis agassizii]|uniref:Uncharacterized protein n=1 Tax=Mycoplasmopsis agassizii TaxID=33922 RepID=A0ABX4H605_9BACT|nr:hypothetical protein [Mycoplasmopsis agassizii]PAF55342.1 hypothetical protein CJF60_01475 [Mycoplasmopsis agassizii]SMC15799.1 hypothetical protein SAMN02745179_00112 [Mycoplasmopsis agassizii]